MLLMLSETVDIGVMLCSLININLFSFLELNIKTMFQLELKNKFLTSPEIGFIFNSKTQIKMNIAKTEK